MQAQKDFKELLELFNKHKVEYVIVGAYALAFHGCPRYTGDLDLLIKPDPNNAKKIIEAIKEFGFESLNLRIEDFVSPEKVVQLGVPPIRIDIITSLTALTWEQIEFHKVKGEYGNIPTYFIGKDELIINKKSLGRHKDLADIESITE
ncbi:MAG: nucleotidyltransferase family protein [Candidatus Omnitrophica bacterium]|nr:nucleotidyltransferase family protein [Candidatus Omnitrophota bacterium]MBU4478823.1 nucleotidyltransferase family protein [Candidatus Omnitrophota bacterium]